MSIFREYEVDLVQYFPEYLKHDDVLNVLLKVESAEHKIQADLAKDIFNQFFVDTATWGLLFWEDNLGLKPSPDDNYLQRRNRIYLKLQGRQTSTKKFMEKLAARYFSDDAKIEGVEDNPNDMFWLISHSGSLLYFSDLINAIDTYIPAHLGFGMRLERKTDSIIYAGAIGTQHKKYTVGMATPKGGRANATSKIGGNAYLHKRYNIGNMYPKDSTAKTYLSIAHKEVIYKKFMV